MKKTTFLVSIVAAIFVSCQPYNTDALLTQEGYLDYFPYRDNGIVVEKIQRTIPVAEFPGLTIVETSFVNHGKTLSVTGYETQRTRLTMEDSIIWSFQPSSSNGRMDWVLPVTPGFEKQNYLGMNNSDYGGGIPVLDIWNRAEGLAIGLIEPVLRDISMPISWKRYDDKLYMCLQNNFAEPMEFQKGDTLTTYRTFRLKHTGDYYNALRVFSQYMSDFEGIKLPESESEAFEPVWCAWGYERTFTIPEIIGTLDKAAELGFTWVDIDDGYQIAEGDWETNSRFPGGDKDMRRISDEIHKRGMKAKLWWAPLAADPGTRCIKEHPEMLLKTDEWAPEYITWWDSYYLSPVNEYTKAYTLDLVRRFLKTWNFDGLKIDGQHLNCCLPDYNEASHLDYPQQSYELLPTFFEAVYNEARSMKPNAVVQICPCGCAVNYYLLPTFNQAVASDPTSSCQVRMKRKAYAALVPNTAYYGDHVELTDHANDFASQIGTGSVIGTKFTYPKDNPNASASFLLTDEKEALIKHWMKIYKEKDLARGEYINLYTWGYDYPEAHVIRQHGALYYAFYADHFDGQIELRGLDASKEYTATLYEADGSSFTVSGAKPYIPVKFDHHYLLEVTENK